MMKRLYRSLALALLLFAACLSAVADEPKRLKAKICLVGEHGVGKTSLVRRYVLDEFDDRYIVTLGANNHVMSVGEE